MTIAKRQSYRKLWVAVFKGIILLAFSSTIMLSNVAIAQPDAPVKTYLTDSYYEEDGLASNLVYQMAQSADGLMWFVTQKGISTFDGLRWNTFDYEITPNAGNNIYLLPLQDGSMLLAGSTTKRIQFAHYRNGSWQTIDLPEGVVISNDAHYLSRTRAGVTQYQPNQYMISLIHKDKLYLYNSADKRWQNYKVPPEINKDRMGRLTFFENSLFIPSVSGLACLDLNTKEFDLTPVPEIAGRPVVNACISPDGKALYILGNNFVGRYQQKEYKEVIERLYPTDPEMPSYLIFHNIMADRNNRLFFNHNSALFKYSFTTNTLEQFKLDNASSEFAPSDIFEDREGNIWFSDLRGVQKISSFRFYSHADDKEFYSSEISTILPLDSSNVLFGGNKNIKILAGNHLKTHHTFAQPPYHASYNRILDALKTPEGDVYMTANTLGLGHLQKDSSIQWFRLPDKKLASAVAWHQDSLLAASTAGSLLYFNPKDKTFNTVWHNNKLYIRKIISENEAIILLTSSGLYKIKDGTTTHIKSGSLQQQNLYSYLKWKGRTLLGSMGGLCELIDKQLVKITSDSLQLDRPIFAMLEDTKGRLWAGTDKGIYVSDEGGFLHYGPQDGLIGKEINRAAFERMPDGSIWIGTDQGLSVYNPDDDFEPNIVPTVRITKVTAQGQELSQPEEKPLSYDQNNLEFYFQTISFYQPGLNNYRYKLEGLDEDWVYSTNHLTNQVRYTNLPPGSYTFVIQARVGNGQWSEPAYSSVIHIQLPFYQSWWFVLLVLAGIGSLGYMAHALMTHKENERKLRQAIEDKKAEVEESEKRFRAVWKGTHTSFVLTSRAGKILMANPAFCRLMHITAEQACDDYISSLLPDDSLSAGRLEQIFDQKAVYRGQVITSIQHQTRYLMVTITFTNHHLQDEQLMLIGIKDETEQKQAETNNSRLNEELVRQNMALLKKEDELANYNHELLQQREELEQALRAVEERNYQLDQFVYKTSHDLRAPISSALGLINIIKMDPDYSRWPEYLELINGSLKKQDTFIKAMLSFSKTTRSHNKAELIDFKELIAQCLEELQTLHDFREVKQLTQVRQEGEFFYSDRMKLYIILSNIISNAIKYRDKCKKSYLQIEVRLSSRGAEIEISDNGIGIASKYQHQIFDMFFRATELSDGSGLGLYIVKQTIEKLQGHIITNSVLGEGSSFKIFIPNQHAVAGTGELAEHETTGFNESTTS